MPSSVKLAKVSGNAGKRLFSALLTVSDWNKALGVTLRTETSLSALRGR